MRSILLVEDDPAVAELISGLLAREGYDVEVAFSLSTALESLEEALPDLAVVDIELPDGSGLDVVARVRRGTEVPVIILSGRAEEVDQVVGLELGADDYVTKPFRQREFVARVRSVLRRSEPKAAKRGTPVLYRFEGWTLDLERRSLTSPAGDAVDLTYAEFELLQALVSSSGVVLSREQLMTAASQRKFAGPHDRSVDVRIGRLREKLGDDPADPHFIRTVRGVGYVFTGGGAGVAGRRR